MVEMRMVCGVVCPRRHYPQMHVLCDPSLDICSPAPPPPLPTIATSQFRAGLQRVFLRPFRRKNRPCCGLADESSGYHQIERGRCPAKNFAKVIPPPRRDRGERGRLIGTLPQSVKLGVLLPPFLRPSLRPLKLGKRR